MPANRARGAACILAALALWIPAAAGAQTVIVPDQFATIQEALDSGAEEVLVRPGDYAEIPSITGPVAIRGLVAAKSDPDSLPKIAGLSLDTFVFGSFHSQDIILQDLRFTGVVENTFTNAPYSNPLGITFLRCGLDGGLNDDLATIGGQLEYFVRRCTIDGPVRLVRPQQAWFDSSRAKSISVSGWRFDVFSVRDCQIIGSGPVGISASVQEPFIQRSTFEGFDVGLSIGYANSFEVDDNVFRGPGLCAVDIGGDPDGGAVGNTIVGFDVGWRQDRTVSMYFVGNRIERCSTSSVTIPSEYVTFSQNTIRHCGAGAVVMGGTEVRATQNVIQSCDGDGLTIRSAKGQIVGNVVGRCTGNGIVATLDDVHGGRPLLKSNTIYLNEGSGCVFAATGTVGPTEIDHNIGYGNGRYGLEVTSALPLSIGCNDWFANAAGAIQGADPGPTDVAVDPLFCDLSQDDVHLDASSPLADAAGCGLIGALGVACDNHPTPVLVSEFTARRGEGGVVIGWRINGALAGPPRVERAQDERGPWTRVAGAQEPSGPLTTLLDREAEATRGYWYRLVTDDESAGARVLGVTSIAAAVAEGDFVLEPAGASPGPGPFNIRFRLPFAAAIDLEVFDVQGRSIAALASGTWPAGTHELRWSGHDANGRISAGLHLVRYRFPGGQAIHRLVLVR